MLIESQGKLEKCQGKVREFCVKNLADTLNNILLKEWHLKEWLFGSYSLPPMSHVVSSFWSIPHPRRWVTYFLNGLSWEFIASKVVIYSFRNRGHHVFMLLIDCQLLNLLSLAHAIIHQVNSTVRRRLKSGSEFNLCNHLTDLFRYINLWFQPPLFWRGPGKFSKLWGT